MRRIKKDWREIELKPGDLLVIYKGTGTAKQAYTFDENTVTVKGNIKRDIVVEKIQSLISREY